VSQFHSIGSGERDADGTIPILNVGVTGNLAQIHIARVRDDVDGALGLGDVERVVGEREVAVKLRQLHVGAGVKMDGAGNALEMELTEVVAVQLHSALDVGEGDIVAGTVATYVAL